MTEADESRPRVTELPKPYEGVAEEVLADLISDRPKFIRESLENMREENRHLRIVVVHESLVSLFRDLTLDWSLAYYEIYARSAREVHTPMLFITRQTIDSRAEERSTVLHPLLDEQDVEAISRYFEESETKNTEIMDQESKLSPELGAFYAIFYLALYQQQRFGGLNDQLIDILKKPIEEVRYLFHSQLEANRTASRFSH